MVVAVPRRYCSYLTTCAMRVFRIIFVQGVEPAAGVVREQNRQRVEVPGTEPECLVP